MSRQMHILTSLIALLIWSLSGILPRHALMMPQLLEQPAAPREVPAPQAGGVFLPLVVANHTSGSEPAPTPSSTPEPTPTSTATPTATATRST